MGVVLHKSLEDGKFSLSDVANFLPAGMKVPAAFGGISLVYAELKDLSDDEMVDLKKFVAENFDISDDKLEEKIEQSIAAALTIWKLIKDW